MVTVIEDRPVHVEANEPSKQSGLVLERGHVTMRGRWMTCCHPPIEATSDHNVEAQGKDQLLVPMPPLPLPARAGAGLTPSSLSREVLCVLPSGRVFFYCTSRVPPPAFPGCFIRSRTNTTRALRVDLDELVDGLVDTLVRPNDEARSIPS